VSGHEGQRGFTNYRQWTLHDLSKTAAPIQSGQIDGVPPSKIGSSTSIAAACSTRERRASKNAACGA
jgi:hypothetical protein